MSEPRAIVIPFGVPSDGQGLGLGLAALVHAVVQVDGSGVGIAQLHAAALAEGPPSAPRGPVEAFVPPSAWQEIAGRGDAPPMADVIITGSFDPPVSGTGMIQILAFDARSGQTRARVDTPMDDDRAGAAVLAAIERLGSHLGGQVGGVEGLGELRWEPLESVLRAERCVLHDPQRGGPHDRLAAMAHLGRAIGDAPSAAYPIARLATIALEAASGPPPLDPRLLSAAVRALERASTDAPDNVGLMEALGALHLRSGRAREAERVASEAIALGPDRAMPYALLSQSLRAQGNLDGALSALMAGPSANREEPSFAVERGMVYTERGDFVAAAAEWRRALARDPVHPVAFAGLADVALRLNDAVVAQSLVDAALAASRVHVDVLRRAVHLALATEDAGIARASRISRLCARILEAAPGDAAACLAWAQALLALGEVADARTRLAQVERSAPSSAAAAEAQMVRLSIDDPRTEAEVKSVLRAAYSAQGSAMADVAARARKLGTMHGAWPAWLAAGVADRHRGKLSAAREAVTLALEIAPGATPAHIEMVGLLIALGEPGQAVTHAERTIALEGSSPRALKILAKALLAAGRREAGLDAATRALALQPGDEEVRAVLTALRHPPETEPTLGFRVRDALARWTKRRGS
jgi:tetratricopeptide (TPR) repeat protein